MIHPENYESRVTLTSGPDIVLKTNGRELWLVVEGDDGRGLGAYLPPDKVRELKAVIVNWERLRELGAFKVEQPEPHCTQCGSTEPLDYYWQCPDCGHKHN